MQELDKYQKEAVLCNKNTLLIAGAGAGKSFTIIKKIDYLLNELHYKENEILVLSFTRESVNDLKKKINHNIDIFTFHKLAMNILDSYYIKYNIINDNYLFYIIDEYFLSLDNNNKLIVLKYFHEYNYDTFINSYKYKELKNLIYTLIKLYKTNNYNKNKYIDLFKNNSILSKCAYIIKNIYDNELLATNGMDFDDLIINATNTLNKFYKYKYIIVDEFQDTSIIRFNLVNKLRIINNATIFCVGDDYQSIYHFSGCNLDIFLNFKKYIPNSKILKLKNIYRNSQELIDIATNFITKNKSQIKKELVSNKHLSNSINMVYYINPYKAFNRLYNRLIKDNNDILVLGRNNNDINNFSHNKVNYLTIHKSKGLEADTVIIINLVNNKYGLPNKIINHKLIEIMHPSDKSYLYAEERRLFYVALTRTKNKVYLLVPIFNKSEFIKEIKKSITANQL